MEEVNSQYDFILNANQKPRRGSGKKVKFLMGFIVLALLAMGGIVGYSTLSSRGKVSSKTLFDIVQKQTEIIRITEIAKQKSSNPDTKALATTIGLSTITYEKLYEKILTAQGTKLTAVLLAEQKDSLVDTKLSAASINNTFDDAFKEVINAKLQDYQTALKEVYPQVTDAGQKNLIVSSSNQVSLILNKK